MAIQEGQRVKADEVAQAEAEPSSGVNDDAEPLDKNVRTGVEAIKAITIAWTIKAPIFASVMLWTTYFVNGMLGSIVAALNPYVTSAFALNSLTPIVSVLSSVIGGVTNLTLAKDFDVFGRPAWMSLLRFHCYDRSRDDGGFPQCRVSRGSTGLLSSRQ